MAGRRKTTLYSETTAIKQRNVRYIVEKHTSIIKGLTVRTPRSGAPWKAGYYLYLDLSAGPAEITIDDAPEALRRFDTAEKIVQYRDYIEGSPLTVVRTLLRREMLFAAYLYEKNPAYAERLRAAMRHAKQDDYLDRHPGHTLLTCDGCIGCDDILTAAALKKQVRVLQRDHKEAISLIPRILPTLMQGQGGGVRREIMGLIYADPYGPGDFPRDVLYHLSHMRELRKVDILITFAATNWKRSRFAPLTRKQYAWASIGAVIERIINPSKKFAYICEPFKKENGKNHPQYWSMVLFSNWSQWNLEFLGFHRTTSLRGRELIYDFDHRDEFEAAKKRERRARTRVKAVEETA
jgi:hypothetical protein